MVEPSPPALHLHSSGDVSMVDVGVKVKQEECGRGGGVDSNSEPLKTSPLHDWSGNQPLEARQLTPPLSRSPSVRMVMKGTMRHFWNFRMCSQVGSSDQNLCFSFFWSDVG